MGDSKLDSPRILPPAGTSRRGGMRSAHTQQLEVTAAAAQGSDMNGDNGKRQPMRRSRPLQAPR